MKGLLHPAPMTSPHGGQTCCLHSRAPSAAAGETTKISVQCHADLSPSPLGFHYDTTLQCWIIQYNVPQQGTWTTCSQPHQELEVLPVPRFPGWNIRQQFGDVTSTWHSKKTMLELRCCLSHLNMTSNNWRTFPNTHLWQADQLVSSYV